MRVGRVMDELLNDFLVETGEHIDAATQQLVLFEGNPQDLSIIASIFRLVHTIKGTCGFLGLTRLETLAHAAEALIGRLREGLPATREVVTLVLASIDRIKFILSELEKTAAEPAGTDGELIFALQGQAGLTPTGAAGSLTRDEPSEKDERLERNGHRDPPPAPRDTASPASVPKRTETIRVTVGSIEHIMVLVSELVLTRNQLIELTRRQDDETVKAPLQRLSALTSDLQDAVMRARMQPVSRLFSSLPRLARELAAECKKKLHIITDGGDTELDRQLIEVVRDPLTHMLRNCADHGIEPPDVRIALGKPETGTIQVRASHEAGYITIDVMDDGRGLDVAKIRDQAVKNGLVSAADAAAMPDDAVYRFVMAPSFSTALEVTSISGRGVGMDVVRENIESVGGSISVSTTLGKGTRFSLKIPLTLAIAPALIVHIGDRRFALPQHSVMEAVSVGSGSEHAIEFVQDSRIIRLRDEVLPIADLRELLALDGANDPRSPDGLAVVMRVGMRAFAILVDGVSDVQEIVVKPLGASLAHLGIYSGHTILGDGSVVLILDPSGIAERLGLEQSREYATSGGSECYTQSAEMTRLLMFRAGAGLRKAIPLSLIGRIEIIAANAIERSGGDFVTQHQGHLMPVLRFGPPENPQATEHPVLVLSIGGESMGLIVDEIIDIIEDCLDVEIAGGAPGVIGTARLRETIVEIIDVTHFFQLARPSAFARGVKKRFEVLVVDDKLFFRDMLSPVLVAAGYKVTTAASGEDALALLDRGAKFDVVVTDTDMPGGMSGYALAKRLKAEPRWAQMPVIAMAAHATEVVNHASAVSGIEIAIGKFDRVALLMQLARLLTPQALNRHDLEARVIEGLAA